MFMNKEAHQDDFIKKKNRKYERKFFKKKLKISNYSLKHHSNLTENPLSVCQYINFTTHIHQNYRIRFLYDQNIHGPK